MALCPCLGLGLYQTSRPVRKSGKFSKSGLSGNQMVSIQDAGLLTLLKIFFQFFFSLKIFLSNFFSRLFFYLFIWTSNFWHEICVQGPYLTRIDNLWLACKMFKCISPDSVWSGRTCLAGPVWQDLSGRTCLAGSVWQVWVSSLVRSGNSCAKSSRALPWVINTQVIKYRHRGGQT